MFLFFGKISNFIRATRALFIRVFRVRILITMGIFIRVGKATDDYRLFGVGNLLKDFAYLLNTFNSFRFLSNGSFEGLSRRTTLDRVVRCVRGFLLLIFGRFTRLNLFRRPAIRFQVIVRFFRHGFFLFLPIVVTGRREDRLIIDMTYQL